MMLHEYGSTEIWRNSKTNIQIAKKCQKMNSEDQVASGLTLDNLMPVFMVQLIGFLLAIGALFLEFKTSRIHPVQRNVSDITPFFGFEFSNINKESYINS